MAIKLSQIGTKTRTVTAAYDGDEVTLTYRPGAFTPRIEARLSEAQEQGRVSQEVAAVLADVLVSWEVLDDEGNALEPMAELLMDFPVDFLIAVTNAISEDMRPKGGSG